MANHRTVSELKPFLGYSIRRCVCDGRCSYYAYAGSELKYMAASLSELKKKCRLKEVCA